MSRTKIEQFSKEEQNKLLRKFFTSVAALQSYQEVANFFMDLFNSEETAMFARRLKIAQFLEMGLRYDEIAAKMHSGFDTIAKVNHWLQYGRGGYKNAVKKLNKMEKRIESRRVRKIKESDPFSFSWIQRKYGHVTPGDLLELTNHFNDFIKKIKKNKSIYKA